ncbi:hypothetical protein GTK63_09680 [Lactobacillus crispatus]|uniref:NADP-dependent oxidoreductase domain-containing protein n=1 Tax=Lactobacillus crispatus TaxID=47770 RepID=A0A7X4HPG9_9LACO|nr:aldo/keto reductase [Lactobacillus crispatus]MYN54557.1 hypothetical protein [Lactobacillus crispatus]
MLKDPRIRIYAEKYHVSPAQLMLAFDLQLGCIVLPKSDNVKEMQENLNINFEISADDMADLVKLKENTQTMAV